MQDHSKSFASLREMVQAADHIARFRQSSRKEGDSYWSGTATFGEAKDLALRGWAEGVAKVRPLAEAIFAHVADKVFVRQPDYSYAGGAVNVGRIRGGPSEGIQHLDERTADGRRIKDHPHRLQHRRISAGRCGDHVQSGCRGDRPGGCPGAAADGGCR